MEKEDGTLESWDETCERVVSIILGALGFTEDDEEYIKLLKYMKERKFIFGGRYLYATGRKIHQVNNCFLLRAEDSREGWAELTHKAMMVLLTGGGVGVDYSDIRPEGSLIKGTGSEAPGPLPLMNGINELGRSAIAGGQRRAAIIALLDWDHPDCKNFIHMKDWPEEIKSLKEKDHNFPAQMDMTNISINLNDEFFEAMRDTEHEKHELAEFIYLEAVANMVQTGEPGFSVNIEEHSGETLRNPCGEVTSADDSDVCNLGSLNLGKIESKEELEDIVNVATLGLLGGTVYSDMPYKKVAEVRQQNRRLGLGIMGVHEWLLQNDHQYEPNDELAEWLDVYAKSGEVANKWADKLNLSRPIATRAVAPTGTLGIIGDTTTGIEPIYCVAYKRKYLGEDKKWRYQYVVDPTAHRLIEENGVDPHKIEDAYSLSYNVEKRLWFQAWIQQYVDMAISSTVNLPYQITDPDELKEFADMLLPILPNLRGITCYPDGARAGQPLEPADYNTAVENKGVVFEDDIDASCRNGVCGA